MIVPNKAIPLKDSIIYKMIVILECEFDEIDLVELYNQVSEGFSTIDEFIYSLDVLFILDKIKIENINRVVRC